MKKTWSIIALILTMFAIACDTEGSELPPKIDDDPAPQTPELVVYAVGDYYEQGSVKGVIYKVADDGRSGMLLALEEGDCAWAWTMNLTGANSATDGAFNLSQISSIADWKDNYPMFKWCAELGSGWYVPSSKELYELYVAFNGKMGNNNTTMQKLFNGYITKCGGTPLSRIAYRSSTEMAEYFAYMVDFASGKTYDEYKSYRCRVRAVQPFVVE